LWYASGLVGHSLVELFARSFYAMHDTRTPVWVGSVAMGLNVALSYLFSAFFQRLGWLPHGGLALANTTATYLEALGLYWIMRGRLRGLEEHQILRLVVRTIFASLSMGIGIEWYSLVLGNKNRYLMALGGILVGGGVFFVSAWLLKIQELENLRGTIYTRWITLRKSTPVER
jgi:putative peptidoglycan lipid II flippase